MTTSGNTAQVWDAISGKPLGEPIKHKRTVKLAQFSPDGQQVVTASGNTARLWDPVSGKPIGETMEHKKFVTSVQFSPDGKKVVTASQDRTARLWDAASGKPLGQPMNHEAHVYSAQFSPDGQRVVTASAGMTARLWDAAIVPDKDTREDILLLAELAEATSGVALETVGQAEILNVLTPEQKEATREKIATKYARMSSGLTSLQRFLKWSVADHRNRRDFSTIARNSFRMAGKQNQGGNSRSTKSRDAG